MKQVLKILFFGLLLFTIYYLLLPSPSFPPPPAGALRSTEPGDVESIYRRAYFTNYSRSEILAYYSKTFSIPFLQFLENYPPEDAFSLIRDQTQSSWLQEIVHPWRESLYVNGFYPTKPTQQINRNGVHYVNKITVRYIPSSPATRLTVLALAMVAGYWLYKEYAKI
jgi:hypothetical protein